MAKRVADVVVETLQAAGVKRCWGVPGDTLNFVTDAIRRSPIEWVHVRHEEVAGFAAGAEAMLTGDLTACAGSCGPGSLHFINGLFESHRNRAPVVLIASQITRDELGFDFPQEVDFAPIYQLVQRVLRRNPIACAGAAQDGHGGSGRAFEARRGGADLPIDVSKAERAGRTRLRGACRSARSFGPATPNSIGSPRSSMPARGLPSTAVRAARARMISWCALADRLKAPVAHTSRAKDFVEYDNPFNVGMTGVFGTAAGYHALIACDTLLLLGCDFAWRQFYPSHAEGRAGRH